MNESFKPLAYLKNFFKSPVEKARDDMYMAFCENLVNIIGNKFNYTAVIDTAIFSESELDMMQKTYDAIIITPRLKASNVIANLFRGKISDEQIADINRRMEEALKQIN